MYEPIRPNPYDYPSADDYYEALDEYNRLTSEEYLNELADQAYDAYKDECIMEELRKSE